MENNNKYYTPSIEEFHVGFEYESQNINTGEWIKYSSKTLSDLLLDFEVEFTRVKYLDKEDIESLGFIYDNELKFPKGKYKTTVVEYVNDIYCLSTFDNHEIMISEYCDGVFDKLFIGTIKNKSELKRLLKQLGIDD
jgi:hypothetical protein